MELIYKLVVVGLVIQQVCAAGTPTPPDNRGTEFILMFMENIATPDKAFNLELYCTTQETTPVTVHVTTPLWSTPRVDETLTVVDGVVQKAIINSTLRMTGSGIDSKGVYVTANAEVSCYGANKETTSNDVFLGLPVDSLGTDYYAVVHSPPEKEAQIGVAGTEDGTTVTITLPAKNGPLTVTFLGTTYHEGQTITVTLDKYKTLQLQSKGDLTGTHIVSSKPVAVFSGNIKTNVGTGTFSDHLVEQMVPSDRWGKEFVTAPIPGRTVGDVFRIVAKTNGTVVTITGRPPIYLNAGERMEFELPSDQYTHITANEPVMIAQFVKSQLTSNEPADPSMMLIPPVEQFGSDYTFSTPEYSRPDYGNASIYRYQNEFMIVAKKSDIGGLLLDGKPFPQTTWKDIPGTNLVGAYVTLDHGAHTVRHTDPLSTFGGYLYGHAYRESYGFPTGMRTALIYSPNCKPTPSVEGDGIDNDCDNKIDEELCTPDNHNNDDDGDGKFDEDCVKTTPIHGLWGQWAPWSSACSVTCGDGAVSRKRKCDAPVPKFGGKNCTGMEEETRPCYGGQPCLLDVANFCASNSKRIGPNPVNCAQYIDCSRNGPYNQTHVFECTYPDLFNTNTLQCDNFENVNCSRRMEPMDPCDYLQNKCNGSDPNCKPCRDRWPTCVGVDDGQQALAVFSPEYVECKKNRTMSQGKCDFGFFDSRTHRCVPHNPGSLAFYCRLHPSDKVPEPHNCAQYYDCTKHGRTQQEFTSECQYPDLFSMATNQCENFSQVTCAPRSEPQAPCEYQQFNCSPSDPNCVPCPDRLPNCVGLTDGNQSYPSGMWKPDYVDCYKNRTRLPVHRCTKGYFHPVLKQCTEIVNKTDAKPYCTANPNDVIAMPDDCAQYIDCTVVIGNPNAEPVKECPYPDLFSTLSMVCQDFTTVQCDKRPEPQAPCEYEKLMCSPGNATCNCPANLPSCVGLSNGRQPFPSRMWKTDYVDCYKNRTTLPTQKCTKGYFHPTLKLCTEDVTKTDATPYCQANPTAIVPLSDNCAQYINCSVVAMGTIADPIQECRYPDLFSKVTLMCVNFTSLPSCDGRREPMAPCEYKQNLCSTLQTPGCTPCPSRLPSCVGVSDGDQPFPGQQWGDSFVHCYRNRTLGVDKCPAGSVFDPNTRHCTTRIDDKNIDSFCQANPTALKINPTNCAQYFNCSNPSSRYGHHLEECPYPMLFSNLTLTCAQFDTVNCKNRSEPQAPCEYLQNLCSPTDPSCVRCPDRLPSCVGIADGNQPFPSRMWKPDYVVCNKNRTISLPHNCTKGYFHPVLKQCKVDVNKTDAKDYCHANPTSVLPMADNCAQYINCSAFLAGYVSDPVLECPYPDLFSTATLRCEKFESVTCDRRNEPQAPCEYDAHKCDPSNPQCTPCPTQLPSCVGLPDGVHMFPGQEWKPDHITCYKNRTVLPTDRCVDGFFHPVKEQCTKDIDKVDALPYCQANPHDMIPMRNNCAQFIDCAHVLSATPSDPVGECTYPDLYSTVSRACQRFTMVTCGTRFEPMAPCEYKQNICDPNNTTCEHCPLRLPSCIGWTDGAQRFPTRLWLADYVQCYRNRTVAVTKCRQGTIFDPIQQACVSDVPRDKMDSYCQANPTAIKKDPDNCAQYFNCSVANTTLGHHLMECKYPDLFSETTLRCEKFETVACTPRHEPKAPCEYSQNQCNQSDPSCAPCPDRLPSCVGLPDGAQPFPAKLWSAQYVVCYKERTVEVKQCQNNGFFNPTSKMCDNNVQRPDAKPYCQSHPAAVVMLQDNCAQYINCSAYTGGQTADPIAECPYPELFDENSLMCRDFQSVTCGSRPEPQAPCEYQQYKKPCAPADPYCIPCDNTYPSCVGQTDGNQPFPSRMWKPDYVGCYKNRTSLPTHKCTKGYFHPVLKQCTEDVNTTDAVPYCQANPRDMLPMATNCGKYYNCTATLVGGDVVQECPYPDLFSTLSMVCQDFTTVQCDKRPEPQAPCEYDQNLCLVNDPSCSPCPDRLPTCVGMPDGDEPARGHLWTDMYVRCYRNRTLKVEHCPSGAVYNPDKLACVTKITSGDVSSYCQSNPHAIKPHETNCAQYYNCSNPYSRFGNYIQECRYPDLFSTVSMSCAPYSTVPCGTRMEPQAPCDYLQYRCNGSDPRCVPCDQRMPSCVGFPDGKNPVAGKEWQPTYVKCKDNRTVSVEQCSTKYFHPLTKTCTDDMNRGDVKDYCQRNPAAIIAAEDNCAQYFNCSDPHSALGPYVGECTYPDLFSLFTMTCSPFRNTLCDSRPEPQAPCQYERNLCPKSDPQCPPCPERLPTCVGRHDGAQPDTTHLWGNKYIECFMNRTMTTRTCHPGEYFHPRLRQCRSFVDPVDVPEYCKMHATEVITNPDNCAVYYNCSDPSSGYKAECPYPDLFDSTAMRCISFEQVDCQNRPVPMAPCQYQQNICDPTDITCTPCGDRHPSCVGHADGNWPITSRSWGPDYVKCYKNRTLGVEHCKTGFFHPIQRTCTSDIGKNDLSYYCDAHPTAVIGNPDNCAQYVNCSHMTPTTIPIQECTYPDLFAADTLTCSRFTTVTCGTRMEPQAPCDYDQNKCVPGDSSCTPCPQRLPSCVGVSDGAQPFTGREWTEYYMECFRNRTMALNTCPSGSVFEPYQSSCISRIDKNAIQSFCQFNPGAVKEHTDNCAQYYNCSQPASPLGPFLMECPYPQLFSSLTLTCVEYQQAQCGRKTEPKAPCDYIKNLCSSTDPNCVPCSSRLPSCEGLSNGPQPYPGRLWQTDYVTCRDNRTITMEKCSQGFFSPQQRSCVDSVTKTNIIDYCKSHPGDIVTDPSNCARYFNCSDPTSPLGPYQEECPYPDLFSILLKSCVPFDTVNCQNRHEPMAPCDYAANQCSPQDPQCVLCAQRLPSCQGLPDGDSPLQGSLWKGEYVRCRANRTISTERCARGYFNPHTRSCQTDVDPVDIVPYCQANPQAVVPKVDNCAQYFLCSKVVGTVATVEECPYPDLFSRSTMQCEKFENVDCDSRPEPQAPCQYSQNQCAPNDPTCTPCVSRLPSCIGEQDGFHPVGGQAWGSGYVECRKNRTISVSQCPQGSYFSPNDHRCTQNINTGDIDSFCRAHPTHIRPHPTNCAQFYDCSASALGSQILRECPYPQLFDSASLTCKPFTNVSCGIRFEPTAPCEYMANQCSPGQTGCVPCTHIQPSCNGLGDGYHAFPGLLWQQQYIICYKNRTTSVTKCTGVQLFNPTSRTCVDVKDLTKPEIHSYCQAHPNSVLADPTDCSRYFQCSTIGLSNGGHLQCTYPDLFSPTSGRCVAFSLVGCGTRKEPTKPCEYDHNLCPASDPACVPCSTRLPDCQGQPDGDSGILGMLWSLNYVRCQSNRTVEVKRCTQGVFDPNIRACSSNIGPSHINDLCFSNPKAIVPHPTNCAQYFDCSKASTRFGHYLMECPYPELFDEHTLTCKPFTQVQCGNKVEPKAPCEYFQNLCPAGNMTCTPCGQRLPSCVGLPDGSQPLPGQPWSPQYMTCSLGRTLALHQCPSGVFDPARMVCSSSVQPVDIPQYCKTNPHAVLPDPSSCSKYFNCSKPETNYQQECLYPMLFSVEISSCDSFRNVQCGPRPEPQAPCEYTQNQCSIGDMSCIPCPQRLPSCRGLPDGINGAPINLWSNMYIQCLQNRTMVVQHCRRGFFNPLQKECVENADPNQVNEVCQANPSAVFPDPGNCAKYYDCRQTLGFGSSYLKECSYPDLFSTSLNSCQNFTTVDCETRTEPQAPCDYDQNQCVSMFNCRPCPDRLASCVGLPDGENAYPGRRWTADHVYCLQNRTITTDQCPSPKIFDPIAKQCTQFVDPSHAQDYCITHPQTVIPNSQNAAQYFDCSQPQSPLGKPYLHECTYPDLFHASNLRCQNFTSVPTDQRPTPQAPCEYERNHCQPSGPVGCVPCPQRLHSCVGLPDGLNPIEGKQWSPEYVNCHLNRTVGSGRCSQGMFDPNTRQCASTPQPGPLSIPDQCRQNPNLLLPDTRSCALYYNCSKSVGTLSPLLPAQLEECEYPKLYSTQYGRCLDFQSVTCNDRHEVMAPCQYLQNQCNSADATCQSCMERLPSCIGLPDGNNPILGRYWTGDYIHCYKNRTLAKETCQTGYFNPNTRQCSDDVSKGNLDDFCKNHPNAKVANADNCAQFYDCSKTLPRIGAPVSDGSSLVIRQECLYPDLFSTITQRCEPFTKVNCDKRPEPQAPCEYNQNQCAPGDPLCQPCPDRLPSCVGLGEGDVAVPGREYTSLYVNCRLNRTLDVKHCQQGFFDAGLHMCVTQINSANVGPYCQRNSQAILPHPTNCAWYYNCSVTGLTLQSVYPYDIEYVQECPYPDLFSAATMRCENFHSVSCRGNFEPQAPCEYLKNRCDPSHQSCIPCPNRIPSCKNLPDGQQVISNLYNQKQYLVNCDKSRTMAYQECTPGSLVCAGMPTLTTTPPYIATTPLPTTPVPTPPPGICDINRGQVVGNPTHCGQYYNCTRLFPPFVFECQYPQMFSEVTRQCEDFQRVSCGARPEYEAPCDYEQNQCRINNGACVPCNQRLPSCVNLPDGNHAFPGREGTSSYITCFKGRTMSVGQCPYGVFDPYREICSTPTTTTIATTTSSNTIAAYCVQHPRNVIPDPTNCHRYYECSTYNTPLGGYLMECPFPQVFDATWTICRDKPYVSCGQRTVPASQCDYKLYQCIGIDCLRCTETGVQTLPPTTHAPVIHTTHPPVTHTTHEMGPNCVGKPDGLNPYPGRELTGYYIVCQHNRLIETGICIIDKILDPVMRRCSYPSEKDVIGPYCRANPGVLIPSDINCAQYYQCGSVTNGYQNVLMECSTPLLFSTIDNSCKHYTQVQCGQRFQPVRP